jgi:hypothetical protein
MKSHHLAVICTAALGLALPGTVLGQSATSSQPATASAPLDVVLLNDGSMFRGTISELVANDHVVIVLASGDSRRFAFSAVRYAGPASGAPETAPSGAHPSAESTPVPSSTDIPVVEVGPFPVQFLATRPDITVYRLRRSVGTFTFGQAGFGNSGTLLQDWVTEICRAPCVTALDRGTYYFSLGLPGEYPVAASTGVRVFSPVTIRAHYESRSGFRMAGWLVAVGSAVTGTVLTLLSVRDCPADDRNCSIPRIPLFATGMGIGLVGTITGLIMTGKDDEATIQSQKWEAR